MSAPRSSSIEVANVRCEIAADLDLGARTALDAFAAASPAATHYQLSAWFDLAPRTAIQHYRLVRCWHDGDLLLTGIARYTKLFFGSYLVTFHRGPVVRQPEDLHCGMPAVLKAAGASGACTVMVNPWWTDSSADAVSRILATQGFLPLPPGEQTMHGATGVVDLRPDADTLLARMQPRGRRSLRKAENLGVRIREAKREEDLQRCDALWRSFVARKAYDTAGLPDFRRQIELVGRIGGSALLAEFRGTVIGFLNTLHCGERAYWLALATSECSAEVPKSYSLMQQAFLIAQSHGCLAYDLAGMPDAHPRDPEEANRAQFKRAFSPSVVRLCPILVRPLDAFRHTTLFTLRQHYRRSWRKVLPLERLLGRIHG